MDMVLVVMVTILLEACLTTGSDTSLPSPPPLTSSSPLLTYPLFSTSPLLTHPLLTPPLPSTSPVTLPPPLLPPSLPPRLQYCVFVEHANATCYWAPGDSAHSPSARTLYTLHLSKLRFNGVPMKPALSCTTSDTHCSVTTNATAAFVYCVAVSARTPGAVTTRSHARCQSGRLEEMLRPPVLSGALSVPGGPRCLRLRWAGPLSFSVTRAHVGKLLGQIQYNVSSQQQVVSEVEVEWAELTACVFKPGTSYSVRLRLRRRGGSTHWSAWSAEQQATTEEDVPSAAPVFWRQLEEADASGWRRVTLLWKVLPAALANGRVTRYDVSCETESGQALEDHGSCGPVAPRRESCRLSLPPRPCRCLLSASNAAGTSPSARLWIPWPGGTEPSALEHVSVTPLNDTSLSVQWKEPAGQSVRGFVVEWSAVTGATASILHWDWLNGSSRALVITEGVYPLVPYVVSVRGLYGERGVGGRSITAHPVYTRQGAPSAGPELQVQQVTRDSVTLTWRPIAMETQHGYIRNYTLHYTDTHGHNRSVCVGAGVLQYSLKGLSDGQYVINARANTDAGPGQPGSNLTVVLESDSLSVVVIVSGTLVPILTVAMLLLVCERVKQQLFPKIPNPALSSLVTWNPKAFWEFRNPPVTMETQYSEVIWTEGQPGQPTTITTSPVHIFSYHLVPPPHTHTHPPPARSTPTLTPTMAPPSTDEIGRCETPPGEERDSAAPLPLLPYPSSYARLLFPPPPDPTLSTPVDLQYLPVGCKDPLNPQEGDAELPVCVSWYRTAPRSLSLSQISHLFCLSPSSQLTYSSPLWSSEITDHDITDRDRSPSLTLPAGWHCFPSPVSHSSTSLSQTQCNPSPYPPLPLSHTLDLSSLPLLSVFSEDCDPYISNVL